MSGEDVYDLARDNWCDLCDAAHLPCEPPESDFDYDCVRCYKSITNPDDETDTDLGWMHRVCAIIHQLRTWASLRAEYEDEPTVLTEAADALDAYRKQTGGLPLESGLIAKTLAVLAALPQYRGNFTAAEYDALSAATFEEPA